MGDLSRNFSSHEFACHCGCGFGDLPGDVSPVLVAELQRLRDALGKPITIVSGCRCQRHNTAVGSSETSQHRLGTAADIQVAGMTPAEVRAAVLLHCPGFVAGGIGLYDTFLHCDVRRHAARWDERRTVA
jgi:uncharacterized protein YcbK (DUF882 family)